MNRDPVQFLRCPSCLRRFELPSQHYPGMLQQCSNCNATFRMHEALPWHAEHSYEPQVSPGIAQLQSSSSVALNQSLPPMETSSGAEFDSGRASAVFGSMALVGLATGVVSYLLFPYLEGPEFLIYYAIIGVLMVAAVHILRQIVGRHDGLNFIGLGFFLLIGAERYLYGIQHGMHKWTYMVVLMGIGSVAFLASVTSMQDGRGAYGSSGCSSCSSGGGCGGGGGGCGGCG